MTVGEPKELWTFEGTRLTEHCLFVGRQRFVLFVPPLLKSFRKEESLQFNHLKKIIHRIVYKCIGNPMPSDLRVPGLYLREEQCSTTLDGLSCSHGL